MAKTWQKITIKTDNKKIADAHAPVIISASRSTDIPAFYCNWFLHRLKKGYLQWQNPFNALPMYVSFSKTRLIVFWSKNPKPIIQHINWLNDNFPNYYFHYTLNDYDNTLEQNVPSLGKRIETFIELSEKIGKEKVIWRFDPLVLTNKIGIDELLTKLENIGNQLKNHTQKLVFSFAQIEQYKKVKSNMRMAGIAYKTFDKNTIAKIAAGIEQLNKKWGLQIASCAETVDLQKYGIHHNKCIDDNLIKQLFNRDAYLMRFLSTKTNMKDKGQRALCHCIMSKDIGQYNTCSHLCKYCYANASEKVVLKNFNTHKQNKSGEFIANSFFT